MLNVSQFSSIFDHALLCLQSQYDILQQLGQWRDVIQQRVKVIQGQEQLVQRKHLYPHTVALTHLQGWTVYKINLVVYEV